MLFESEYKGEWYIPGHKRKSKNGRLSYSEIDGLVLELEGTLHEYNSSFDPYHSPPIIWGITPIGEKITLLHCMFRESKGNSYSRFETTMALVGKHFRTIKDIKFGHIFVTYQHLAEWVSVSGFKREFQIEPFREKVEYSRPETLKVSTSPDYELSIIFLWSEKFSHYEINMKQNVCLGIKFSSPKTIDWCMNFLRHLQDFLTLAMMTPTYPLSIEVAKHSKAPEQKVSKDKNIKLFFNPIQSFVPKVQHPADMLFTFLAIKGNASRFIQNWFSKKETLQPIYNLYFSNLYSPFSYLDNRFLNLTQAIESYHRRIYGGKYQDDEEFHGHLYKSLANSIPSDIDKDFKQSLLKGKLRYANEYSLRTRLKLLLKIMEPCLPVEFLHHSNSRQLFITQVVDTRNYLTHYDELSKGEAVEGTSLAILEQKLKLLLEACLLKEMGFEEVTIQELVTGGKTYRTILDIEL